ncbi:AAA family ATPase [Thiomicrospira microaerophila]|uniref:bifunctional aminoglycoside phosphotransferase/ATP-binding protein n=1 Tax=Thiomicrospira microaerophila TaxID=406020 RepID=UPI00200D4F13|nr:bifunctional aminoglycoside phosphotransferase/ATP-binding protein [Thiomicrospira microaerophila]UQB41367.1 AAA family ATPase [Thiomicrospira microaerophila]
MTCSALQTWLTQPQNYPHLVESVHVIETHISAVFLTGNWVYKLKKPVNFGFLDFSTPGQREKFCQLELTLNQRTAPQIYHQVVTVYGNPPENTQFSFVEQPGLVAVDYLVKMHQFDPNCVLSRYLQHHSLTDQQVDDLVVAIAQLHQIAEPIEPGSFLGSSECVLQPMTDNFPSLYALFETTMSSNPTIDVDQVLTRLKQLELWTVNQHALLTPLIDARQQKGHVRACHGDLHLDNITLYQQKPLLFDGIEFNDQFRWIDTLSDLAFLLIDLDYRQKPMLAKTILHRYLQLNGDYAGLVLLRFYQTYRALVRAKITGLRYLQLDPLSNEANDCMVSLMRYIDLAESYAYLMNETPVLYIMQGVSGSGKSYYAQQIHRQTGALVVSSDRERKRLFGINVYQRVSAQQKKNLYSTVMNQATYDQLHKACQSALQAGLSVVADATFLKQSHRQRFIKLAEDLNCQSLVVSIQPNPALAESFIAKRMEENKDPSDADALVMKQQLKSFEPPNEAEQYCVIEMRSELPNLKEYL